MGDWIPEEMKTASLVTIINNDTGSPGHQSSTAVPRAGGAHCVAEASAHLSRINDRDNDDRSDLDTDLVRVRQTGAGLRLALLGAEQRHLHTAHEAPANVQLSPE